MNAMNSLIEALEVQELFRSIEKGESEWRSIEQMIICCGVFTNAHPLDFIKNLKTNLEYQKFQTWMNIYFERIEQNLLMNTDISDKAATFNVKRMIKERFTAELKAAHKEACEELSGFGFDMPLQQLAENLEQFFNVFGDGYKFDAAWINE